MLTIFTAPKPFSSHVATIQTNAIRSWLELRPPCEIILFGSEDGTAEVAKKLNCRHISEVKRNEYGTPLINDLYKTAQDLADFPLMCYINADIILMNDFIKAVERVARSKSSFLGVGQRWDLDVEEYLEFGPGWQERLRARVIKSGQLHPPSGSDFFFFPRGMWKEIPPFAVGRPGWDNWLIYRARALGIPVVDITRVVSVIHQNHDYLHVVEGRTDYCSEGPEGDHNRKLGGGWDYIFTLLDATHMLTGRTLLPAIAYKYLRRRCRTLPVLNAKIRQLVQFAARVRSGLHSDRVGKFPG